MDHSPPASPRAETVPPGEDRLDSWKEIAAYLRRDVTTVQRWERREGMPVHRHLHDKAGSVYAFRGELASWAASRTGTPTVQLRPGPRDEPSGGPIEPPVQEPDRTVVEPPSHDAVPPPPAAARRPAIVWWAMAAAGAVALVLTPWLLGRGHEPPPNPLSGARFEQLTNFGGVEHAAALSRDGRFVAFLSDRDGPMDVLVSQIGTGLFYNLTRGSVPALVNPSVRTIGFSPDGTAVTFWSRRPAAAGEAAIGIWAVPVLGGPIRPYLEGAAELDWSSDGSRLVYHTPGPGDPMLVRNGERPPRQIFSAPPGLHAHYPVWSPDQSFICFVQGTVPDRMDVWRIAASGGTPERLTSHASRVSHPVFLDARTLLYLADEPDGAGASLYRLDLRRRASERVSVGVQRYTSLAASADGGRLVASVSRPTSTLWRIPVIGRRADTAAARRIQLTTGNGLAPRLGPDFLVYLTSSGAGDSLWKLQRDVAAELWTGRETRVTGAPAISPGGSRLAFVAERNRQTSLYVLDADGTNARVLTSALQLKGAPAWSPDERSIVVGVGGEPTTRLFRVPLDGSAPSPLVDEPSVDPAWSPDGRFLAYSGPDIGTTFQVSVIEVNAGLRSRRKLALSRGSRHLRFMPGGKLLLLMHGEIGHKDLWLVDLESGAEHRLTEFARGLTLRDFDVSPDGREIVVEQVQERSDIVLIDLVRR